MADTDDLAVDSGIADRLEAVLDLKPSDKKGEKEAPKEVKKTKPEEKLFVDQETDDDEDDEVVVEDEDEELEEEDDENEEEPTIASYLGLKEDQLIEDDDGNILFNANIDGKITAISVEKLVQGYQTDAYNSDRSMKLSESKKVFETERDRVVKETQENLQGSILIADAVEKEILDEANNVDWTKLKAENPSQFLILQGEFRERVSKVEQMKVGASTAMRKYQEETSNKMLEEQKVHIAEEKVKLIGAIPALSDSVRYEKTMTSARDFLKKTYKVDDDQMEQIFDHRLIQIILDAQKFHAGKAEVVKLKLKGKKLPKFQKSGSRRSKAAAGAKAQQAKRARAKKTGSTTDVANALVDRM